MKKYLSMVLALVVVISGLGVREINAAEFVGTIDDVLDRNVLKDIKNVEVDANELIVPNINWNYKSETPWKHDGHGFYPGGTPESTGQRKFELVQDIDFSKPVANRAYELKGKVYVGNNDNAYFTAVKVEYYDFMGRSHGSNMKSFTGSSGEVTVSAYIPKNISRIRYILTLIYPSRENAIGNSWKYVKFTKPELVITKVASAGDVSDEDASNNDNPTDGDDTEDNNTENNDNTSNNGSTENNDNTSDNDNQSGNNEVQEYKVRFITGTDEANDWTDIVAPGDKVVEPTWITKQGYRLRHWRLQDAEPYDFREPIYGDLILVAEWEEEIGEAYHIVNLDTNGGNLMRFREVQNGHALERPVDPVKTGATFKYWELNGEEYDFSLPVTAQLTLKAVWQENLVGKFTVSFETDGGTPIPDSQEVLANKKAKKPDVKPVKAHSKFLSWQRYGNDFDFENTPITESITLTANYGPMDTYEVKFDTDGGSPTIDKLIVESGSRAMEPQTKPRKEGYKFVGWYKGSEKFNFQTAIERNYTLKAKYERVDEERKAKRSDIKVSNEEYDKAIISYNKPFFKGYPGNLFKPEDTVTRGQLATIFARLLKIEGKTPSGNKSFTDLDGHWAKNAVLNVADYGLINGYPDGTYKLDAPMKRSEIASIINKYWQLKGFNPDTSGNAIVDVNDHWSKAKVYGLYNYGFADLYLGNKYMPEAPLKRSDVAQILNRITDRPLIHLTNQKFEDVPSTHWAYDEINTAATKVD